MNQPRLKKREFISIYLHVHFLKIKMECTQLDLVYELHDELDMTNDLHRIRDLPGKLIKWPR